ncbi:MAG: hypothetical protein AAGI38_05715 [Bacteroidota bacterium]
MATLSEKYINPFTDEDNLKHYRDLKNSLDTAFEEGLKKGREQGVEQGIKGLLKLGKLSDQEIADVFSVEVEVVRRVRKEIESGE